MAIGEGFWAVTEGIGGPLWGMYELKKMNDGASLCHKVLHEAFLLAKSETASRRVSAPNLPPMRTRQQIRALCERWFIEGEEALATEVSTGGPQTFLTRQTRGGAQSDAPKLNFLCPFGPNPVSVCCFGQAPENFGREVHNVPCRAETLRRELNPGGPWTSH